ncbi:uncharacterized protein LOC133799418 [Humulus lupulus]|uniref:uncharacterized protein LOC133799418 n=1 Tax=Humulus lupulus TaxID=3486 RepID=UPI002B408446|nr:uncharacterized protein LOC133799418 [Humulus lupulus]
MVQMIHIRSSRNLSYMGRVTLINSVLISIHSYWAQIMILPKLLLRRMESICQALLWKGTAKGSSPGQVAWENVCLPQSTGGLGFRNVINWNTVAMGKYVWAIAAKKDNLWVRWIHSVYLSNGNWWNNSALPNCSWYWKKIVAVKDIIKTKIDLSTFIAEGYSIQQRYAFLYLITNRVQWNNYVWGRLNIPKHRFIFWLAMKEKLRTRVQISKYDPSIDHSCLLCGDQDEDEQHLFFACPYSRSCLARLKTWLSWRTRAKDNGRLLLWIDKAKQIIKVRKQIIIVVLAALVYHIWLVRNYALWNHKVWCINHTVQRMQNEVKFRMFHIMPRKAKNVYRDWFEYTCSVI